MLETPVSQPVDEVDGASLRRDGDVAADVGADRAESDVQGLLGRRLVDAKTDDLIQHRAPRGSVRAKDRDAAELDRSGIEAAIGVQ